MSNLIQRRLIVIGVTIGLPIILALSFLEIWVREQRRALRAAWLEVKINIAVYRNGVAKEW